MSQSREVIINTLNSLTTSLDWLKSGFLQQISLNLQILFKELDEKDLKIVELSTQINALQDELLKKET